VPDELSVIGFDDLAVAPYVGLTTIRQELAESGRRGIERLRALLAGNAPPPRDERLDLTLVERRTTAPPG
jgi:DNA-binding LacI/PurR family transcriptional regulator